jgi:hypothetical protein
MIAVVSSCIAPSALPSHDGARTTLAPEVRLEQTQATLASLRAFGVRDIFVADNSAGGWLELRAAALAPARVRHFAQPPIRNKGIGELWLLLGLLDELPADEPILKISGRYRIGPASRLTLPAGHDVAGRVYTHGRTATLSTRCYLVRNRDVAGRLWLRALDEIYAEHARIRGPRSLWRIARDSLFPARDSYRYGDPDASLEAATLHAIRRLPLRLHAVDHLDVEGILGSWINPTVKE